jgi:hypothetical protein
MERRCRPLAGSRKWLTAVIVCSSEYPGSAQNRTPQDLNLGRRDRSVGMFLTDRCVGCGGTFSTCLSVPFFGTWPLFDIHNSGTLKTCRHIVITSPLAGRSPRSRWAGCMTCRVPKAQPPPGEQSLADLPRKRGRKTPRPHAQPLALLLLPNALPRGGDPSPPLEESDEPQPDRSQRGRAGFRGGRL